MAYHATSRESSSPHSKYFSAFINLDTMLLKKPFKKQQPHKQKSTIINLFGVNLD